MATQITFVYSDGDLPVESREVTEVSFSIYNEDVTFNELLDYFVRFALAAGFSQNSIDRALRDEVSDD